MTCHAWASTENFLVTFLRVTASIAGVEAGSVYLTCVGLQVPMCDPSV